jgi:hypothetical protein
MDSECMRNTEGEKCRERGRRERGKEGKEGKLSLFFASLFT